MYINFSSDIYNKYLMKCVGSTIVDYNSGFKKTHSALNMDEK